MAGAAEEGGGGEVAVRPARHILTLADGATHPADDVPSLEIYLHYNVSITKFSTTSFVITGTKY